MMWGIASSLAASQTTINILNALLETRTGQQMAAYRSWRLDTALKPLLRVRKLDNLDQLVPQLLHGSDRSIDDTIMDALVNQETSFFRDAQVFKMLAQAVAEAERDGHRARIWCAGCSKGAGAAVARDAARRAARD
jgi:chemotaxis protein methyltransferase CheR